MEKITINELMEECLYIYDDDLETLSLHVYYLHKKLKKTSLKVLSNNLIYKKNLEIYRFDFINILDSFKSEIDKFKIISKYDINSTEVSIEYIFNNLDVVQEKLNQRDINKLSSSIVNIIYNGEKILRGLENGEKNK